MERDSLAFTPAVELAQLLKAKKMSPVELVDLFLKRIEGLNPKLNAYLTVTSEEAREAARKAEKAFQQEEELPPLFGIPISIKDLFLTRGIRTTNGSITDANCVPNEDALSVERLRKAGVTILGKAIDLRGHWTLSDTGRSFEAMPGFSNILSHKWPIHRTSFIQTST